MKTPSLEEFKAWARENHDLAMDVVRAQAYAETMREAVDKIERKVLAEIPLYDDMTSKHERITDPKLTYLSKDDAAFQRYVEECSKRERAAGLKPASMPDEYCPALVAEHERIKLERKLLDSGGALFGFGADQLASGDLWKRVLKLMIGGALKETGQKRHGLQGKRAPPHSRKPRSPRLSR